MHTVQSFKRPTRIPPRLRVYAEHNGIPRHELAKHIGELVASYPSHQAAATHIGVSRITLSRWMQFLGVEVTNG